MITNRRNENGLKDSADQYRKGGQRVLFIDGLVDTITFRAIAEIRAAGMKCWRTGDQVWINAADLAEICALNIDLETM